MAKKKLGTSSTNTSPNVEAVEETSTVADPTAPPTAAPVTNQHSHLTKGLILILTSSLLLSFQNVVTRVILSPKSLFGLFDGIILNSSFSNSLLILVLRCAVVLPIMAFLVAPRLHKNTWQDILDLSKPENKTRLYSVMSSGLFLFCSQLSMYIALGSIPTGIATTIFFIYPTITILLMWAFFKDRPSLPLVFAMVTIYIGGFMTIPAAAFTPKGDGGNFVLGAITAALSGVAFAGYIIMIKNAKMHPAPFTIVNFSIIFVLGLAILLQVGFEIDPSHTMDLVYGTLILATTTLIGYLLQNFGVPLVGPSLASVIGASGPAVTALMAFFLIGEKLDLQQGLGVFLVTLWVLGISVENMKKAPAPTKK
ncbi:MAG: DMT family transporter [Leptospiraceae bacterium]|nr:DMT family transporter [Leptospiraceae bacterium]